MKKLLSILCIAFCCVSLYAQKDANKTHVVKWFEDLSTISAKYGVPVDVIKAWNNLESDVLKSRQKLIIPMNPETWPVLESTADVQEQEEDQQEESVLSKDRVTLGLALPFSSRNSREQANAMDFYSGVLLAAKELGEKGINIDIKTTDPESAGFEYPVADMVIGPFKYSDFESLAAQRTQGIIVSPLDQKTASIESADEHVVQAAASQSDQYYEALASIQGDVFTVITCKQDISAYNSLCEALNKRGIKFNTCYCDVQGEIEGWEEAYREEVTNIVIIAINNEAVLNNAVRNMGIEENKGNILCYAGSKVSSYESIAVENLHRAHIHELRSYYIDYEDPATLEFIRTYRALYNTDPNQYAFQGHDLAYFLISTYHLYGESWSKQITEHPQENMLQCNFKLKRSENGVLLNVASKKIEYQRNYTVELIK